MFLTSLLMTSPSLVGHHLRAIGQATLNRLNTSVSTPAQGGFFVRSPIVVAVILALIPTISLATIYYSVPETSSDYETEKTLVSIPVKLPDLRSQMAAIESRNEVMHRTLSCTDTDTLASVLARLGIRDDDALEYISSVPDARELIEPIPGQFVSASVHEDGSLIHLRTYIDRHDGTQLLEIIRKGSTISHRLRPYKYDTQLAMANGFITAAPDASLQKGSIPNSIISQMHNAFDYDRDVVNQMVKGDAYRIIYEAHYADGNFVRYGRLLAMQLEHNNQTTELFWFADDDRGGDYYDYNGKIARRTFMRVPLDVKSVSSEFSPLRRHPITGVLRPHLGTDFRAPWGATVRAAADGVVSYSGPGTGYGKYIKIQHGPDCVTLYAHLSHINEKIRPGYEVKYGEAIGRVGQTGLATGPHLHYELKIDGVQINPMTAAMPDYTHLTPYKQAQMHAQIASVREKLSLLQRVQVAHVKESKNSSQ